jgi:hypothetical protein
MAHPAKTVEAMISKSAFISAPWLRALPSVIVQKHNGRNGSIAAGWGGWPRLGLLLFEFVRGFVEVLGYPRKHCPVRNVHDVLGQSAAAPGLTAKMGYFVGHKW